MDVPPVAVVKTLYVTPVAGPLAVIVEVCPAQIALGVAVTVVAAAGVTQATDTQYVFFTGLRLATTGVKDVPTSVVYSVNEGVEYVIV
jgi:hypothetical protein